MNSQFDKDSYWNYVAVFRIFFIPSNLLGIIEKALVIKDINAVFICLFSNIDLKLLRARCQSSFFRACIKWIRLSWIFFSIWWCNQSNRYAFNMANINRLRIYLIFLFFQKSNNVMKRAKNRNFRFKTSCILFAGFNDRIFIGWTVLWLTQSESHYSASQVIIFNRILFQDAKQLRN